MADRDPRLDPRPGDLLRCRERGDYLVEEVTDDSVTFSKPGSGPVERRYTYAMVAWRALLDGTEVVRRGPDAA